MPEKALNTHYIQILAPGYTPPIDQALRMATRMPEFLHDRAGLCSEHTDALMTDSPRCPVIIGGAWRVPEDTPPHEFIVAVGLIQRRLEASVRLSMEAHAMHYIYQREGLAAYRTALKAYQSGAIDVEDLHEVSKGLNPDTVARENIRALNQRVAS